ncbi:sulfotransferase [Acidisoma sp. C75]
MSDAVFVVGYYRSGTSALSGMLQALGVAMHNDAAPNEHNPRGFFEIPELIEFDVELFDRLGRQWTDLRPLDDGWDRRADMAAYHARVGEILRRRFGQESLWGLKHPHICRLLPIYERAASEAGHKLHVIHIGRDPWTVAASQAHKNGLSRAHALLLWASYLVTAERNARHLPRSWLTYTELLKTPTPTLRRVEQDLGLSLINRRPQGLREANAFITAQLDRSRALPRDGLLPPLERLVDDIWQAVQDRESGADAWEGFAQRTNELVGFVSELSASRGSVMPWQAQAPAVSTPQMAETQADGLRPGERLDAGAKARLLARLEKAGPLPRLSVFIAAPPHRAHAVAETLQALQAQWHRPDHIQVLSTDELNLPDIPVLRVSEEPGRLTEALCDLLNAQAGQSDYVAILNAGDLVAPDACLRLALEAGSGKPDMLYTDEVVQRDGGAWVRHKPAWEATRLRQSPFVGDWVWYGTAALARIGGFDPLSAGAEEYDVQLRLAEIDARVVRVPEAVFTRSQFSRRDNIPSTVFTARAATAIATHLARGGMPAEVKPRDLQGLYRHERSLEDPGTTLLLLCDGAEISDIDQWLRQILSNSVLTGPIILAGAELAPQTATYLTQIIDNSAALEGKVLAVPPVADAPLGDVLRQAIGMVSTAHLALLDARAIAVNPDWQAGLRSRFADPRVAVVAARALTPLPGDASRLVVQGPIIIGAEARLGAGHLADDPGPGGWLAVDQEASALAPPALLARTAALAACSLSPLSGDAFWIDLGAQLRAAGLALVWTPDVSFAIRAGTVRPDFAGQFRQGSLAARDLSWEDPFHHPALSLRGDPLAPEQCPGLVRAAPYDANSLLLTGPIESAHPALNAARALRATGAVEASWAPGAALPAEIGRRAAARWIRIDPQGPALRHAPPHDVLLSRPPAAGDKEWLKEAGQLYATSPGLAGLMRKLLPPHRQVALWRPALSRPIWESFTAGTGINSRPRILWVDEGVAPDWLSELINQTMADVLWVIVERPESSYAGSVTRIRRPDSEQGWAHELANVAPHLFIRPVNQDADAVLDQYQTLLAAAAGCRLMVDDRLDTPAELGALRLANRFAAWHRAITQAVGDLQETIALGQQARAACLALPAAEEALPPWAEIAAGSAGSGLQAAE